MLQAIREKAQGWIAWVIVILISIPFALWGIQEYLGVGSEPVVATVNGEEITAREVDDRVRRVRQELRERQGNSYDPERYPDAMLREQVLDEMIREQLILKASLDMGLRAGDDQVRAAIQAIPAFQSDGQFDMDAFKRALSYQGLSTIQFEQQVRGSLMTTQLSQVVSASEFVTRGEADETQRLLNQKRSFDYFVVPADEFASAEPSDDQINAFYEANQDRFLSPERVKLEYLVLDSREIATDQEPDEATLRQLYEERKGGYGTPEERRARHILMSLAPDADEAAEQQAKDKITQARERILAGEDFAAVAEAVSEDPGSASMGGDLGFFGPDMMDPAFEKAAFAQQQGEIGEPIRSSFGYHLIEVTGINPGSSKSFEEVRDELVDLAGHDGTVRQFFELAERFEALTYENPDSLEPAAEALGLKVQRSDWLTRDGGDDLFAEPKIINTGFSDQVLWENFNSDPVQLENETGIQAIVVRKWEYEESTSKPIDEVREEIVTALTEQAMEKAAAEEADKLTQAIQEGQDAANVAAAYPLESGTEVARNDSSVPVRILQEAFTLAPPEDDKVTVGVTTVPEGSAVIVLRQVMDGKAEDDEAVAQEAMNQALSRAQAQAYYDKFVDYLRSKADIKITKPSEDG